MVTGLLIRDAGLVDQSLIEERKRKGIDRYDEVWEGMYVMPLMPNNAHQTLLDDLGDILTEVVKRGKLGKKVQGANVSDRRKGWDHNYRVPDLLVVLNNSRAVDSGTHFCGGPDFLVEIQSPRDDTEEKVPFYGKIGVRELLIVHTATSERCACCGWSRMNSCSSSPLLSTARNGWSARCCRWRFAAP